MTNLLTVFLFVICSFLASCTVNDPKITAGKSPDSSTPVSTPSAPATSKPNKISVTADKTTLSAGETILIKLVKTNSSGTTLPFEEGSDEVEFTISDGTSTGVFSTITKKRDGIFYVNFKGVLAGSAVTVNASINGTVVSSSTLKLTVVPGLPAAISVSSGSGQTGNVNSALASPLVARVNDDQGNVVSGATVNWSILSGTGTLGSATVTTDTSGMASTAFTLGTTTGDRVVQALINGTTISTNFTVTASPGVAVAANSSIATTTTAVVADGISSSTVTVVLKDQYNNPLVGVVPTFSATNTASGNQYGVCSATSSAGSSTCTLKSTYGESKTVSLVTPIVLTGNSVNFYGGATAPSISAIADVNRIMSSASVDFTITDSDDILTCSTASLTATSSNTSLLPVANIVFSGSGTNCTATLTPVSNVSGTVSIQVSVSDGVHVGSRQFNFVVAPMPSLAFSVRKLISSYAGSAMRVRRSSDNAEANIGFTAAGDLDTTALQTFIGSSDGYVKIWYDQTGNNQNLSNLVASTQPLIAVAGVISTANTKPSIYFDGTPNSLTNFDVLYLPSGRKGDGYVSAVMSFTAGGDGFILSDMLYSDFHTNPSNNSLTYPTPSFGGNPSSGARSYSESVFYLNGTRFQNFNVTSGSLAPFVNQLTTIQFIPASYSNTTPSLRWDNIGSDRNQYHALNGKYSELIVYKNFPGYSARQAVETLAKNYFSTNTTPVSTNLYTGTLTAPTSAYIAGTSYAQYGQCHEFKIVLSAGTNQVAPFAVPLTFTLGVPTNGEFFSDSGCTTVSNTVVVPAGETTQSFYFKTSPTSYSYQTLMAVGPFPVTSQGLWSYTTPGLSAATLTMAPSNTIEVNSCNRLTLALNAVAGDQVPYPTPTAATFTLGGNVNTGVTYGAFYSDQTCTTPITSVTIPAGASQVNYYYKSPPPATSKTMTFTVTGIRNQSLSVNLKAPSYFYSIAMTTTPYYYVDAGACIKVSLDTKDQYNSYYPLTSTTVMTLTGNTQGSFYSNSTCTTTTTSITLSAGQYHGDYYYKGPTVVSNVEMTFSASGGGVTGSTPARLKGIPVYTYISWPLYYSDVGVCSPAVVGFMDQNSSPFTTTATASSTITGGASLLGTFYTDSTCTTPALTRSVPSGSTTQTLYYKASTGGCAYGTYSFAGQSVGFNIETESCGCGCGD